MAVQIHRRRRKTWIVLALAGTVAGTALVWQQMSPHRTSPVAHAQPSASTAPQHTSALQQLGNAAFGEALAQHVSVTAELRKNPVIQPIKGPIGEKPDFVSHLEWAMLKAAANQQAKPQEELTRLVHFLRFTKQLEMWQDMPKTAAPADRQLLANQLLEDLPQRVLVGDVDIVDARKLQASLMVDAVPDVTARKARADREAKRLVEPPPTPKKASM